VEKIIVGSEEWCLLPDIGIPAVKARVDSGAKTSALHAFNIRAFSREGVRWVSFDVHPLQKNRAVVRQCEAPIFDRRAVKSSTGTIEKRYVIKVPLTLGAHTWETEITLTNRDSMGYRMLLGSEAMAHRVLVDPAVKMNLGRLSKARLAALYGIGSADVRPE